MRIALLPSRHAVHVLTALAVGAALALLLGAPLDTTGAIAAALLALGALWAALDLARSVRAWRAAPLVVERDLPAALAIGVARTLELRVVNPGRVRWHVEVYDHVDASIDADGLPLVLAVGAHQEAVASYRIVPRRRGLARFASAELRVRSLGGTFDLRRRAGDERALRVYPNFAAVARYAWLAGDRRLTEIGIKSFTQRGAGTDFKQLAEYSVGDPIRHIDWKATLRHAKPIVREFQDERDQCVLFVLDCGRRMRADEGSADVAGSHFDQALNALMLLTYVALDQGDEVGAMTFGTTQDDTRRFAPRKGSATLNALIGTLYDVQPSVAHSDYLLMARDVMQRQHKRALIVVLTNFRDEDAPELEPALRLLRTRHLVMLASLRERVVREIAEQPLTTARRAVEAAGAHLFEQARRDAFNRLAARDALLVDVEPQRLPVELVNRYHAVKRAGLL